MNGSHILGLGLGITLVAFTGTLALSSGKEEKHADLSPIAITLEQAIQTAKTTVPGRVLEAELEKEDGKVVYEVDIAGADGNIHELTVDADSGKVLKNEVEDEDHDGKDSEHDDHESEDND
ncbi:MAG: hypothetical protein D6690_14070 [Nitrospirae bacterium]|nr:MAG: hypothetical protein D6690_14070 [Nitrospirota bacterium]